MNGPERLFLAIGGADPELVARSERQRKNHWLGYGLAAAACLTLVLALGRMLPAWTGPSAPPPDSQDLPSSNGQLSLPEQGSEIGTLRLLRYSPDAQNAAVDFLIYVNEEQFDLLEENGLYRIQSIHPLPEDFPECGLDIFHLPGASPSQARRDAKAALEKRYLTVSTEEPAAALPDSLYLRAGGSLDRGLEEAEAWDAEQVELWFAGDGRGGTFVLTSRYFLEAEEGLGARFRDMVSSFRAVDMDASIPDWMRALYTAVDRLSPALLSNDLSGVSDLLTAETNAETYGENVWTDAAIISVDYTLDNDQNPAGAAVSVTHRLYLEEGDACSRLTMHLVRRDGNWYLDWSAIENPAVMP